MRVILIRHGQTASNVNGHLDTAAPGAPLTELGTAQAEAIPTALAARGEKVVGIIASPLLRTQQTAAPLAGRLGMEVHLEPGLREIEAGEYEMRNDTEAVTGYIGVVFGWDKDASTRMPGGCTGDELMARYDEALASGARAVLGEDAVSDPVPRGSSVGDSGPQRTQAGDPALVVISHGAAIRSWVGMRADNLDLDTASAYWLPNTGMLVVSGDPTDPGAGWHLEEWLAEPLGGPELTDRGYHDPTGEPEDEAIADAQTGDAPPGVGSGVRDDVESGGDGRTT